MNQFHVTTAANVPEPIHLIDTDSFDVLLSDLHMAGAGDGFAVISAMRHKNPNAITLLLTGYPALKEAMDAILLQAGEILVNPPQVAPASTAAAPATVIAPAAIVSGGGTAPYSRGFVPNGPPGTVQQFRPDCRGQVFPGQRTPNYPNSHGNRPPPPMPRGAPRPAWGNHPTAPPPRHK